MTGDLDEADSQRSSIYLGLPPVTTRRSANQAVRAAKQLFEHLYGPSEGIEEDLDRCSVYFDPVAQGQRLRRELTSLERIEINASAVPGRWLLRLPDEKLLLTPEGVAGMHALQYSLARSAGDAVLLEESVLESTAALLDRYVSWSRHRVNGVVRLLEGVDKPLQVQAAGALIALLINNNVGRTNAISRQDSRDLARRDAVDQAFFKPVAAFTRAIAPNSKIKSGGAKLISGWPMGEIARRFGSGFVANSPKDSGPGLIYIEPEGVERAIELIAKDLARGHRRRPTVNELAIAIDELVDVFRQNRSVLAGYGELHENSTNTAAIRGRILAAYGDQLTGQPA